MWSLIATAVGCGIMVYAWVTQDGTLVFTRDEARVEEARLAGEQVTILKMAPSEFYDLPEPQCDAVKQRIGRQERREEL